MSKLRLFSLLNNASRNGIGLFSICHTHTIFDLNI